ncbi:hypothetical protein Leryth_009145 [Lithospermum erythrorhizon]|nr:hypothetical protein Leryth_009145 [Lithospermum erythrorhizon]
MPKENKSAIEIVDCWKNCAENTIAKYNTTFESLVQQIQNSNSLEQKHKFWETQPVGQFKDIGVPNFPEGPIELPTPLSEVKQEPYNLPSFEVYTLLTNNHVEDYDHYSKEFLQWALCHRVKVSKKLVAFISGIPANIRVRDQIVRMVQVNFLVSMLLRSQEASAPVLIKEVTRRIHLEDVWQAAYTAGAFLPTLVTTCRYWHRTLNPKKLIDVGFSRLGERMTMSRAIKLYKLPASTVTPGLRELKLRDVPAVTRLLRDYLSQFVIAPYFDENDVEHWLVPRENVMNSYVVESPATHEMTDFFSFYSLPSSILHNPNYSTLKA